MKRIQRKRTKGWKMPENAIYVGRPTKWGNPFRLTHDGCVEFRPKLCYYAEDTIVGSNRKLTMQDAVNYYKKWMLRELDPYTTCETPPDISELKGKDLVCWCSLNEPCHADILIELLSDKYPNQ